ncbi:hypothetical protein CHARACLAT_009553 [Characodon lateralis]|uniref:Uncharacterized protein n=1 Tax=Characodon lateralis TaxID=208331 RepID=A0ABU7F1J2_9TELE|nr:hypothetical protein [Characodon lateralis]
MLPSSRGSANSSGLRGVWDGHTSLATAASSFPLSRQQQHHSFEHSDSPSPTSASTFYYSLNSESPYPESSAGAQPHAGHSPPGQLPRPPPMAAKWNPAHDDAVAFSALPPVAAGDGTVLKVMEVPRYCTSDKDDLNTEEPDSQMTLM